MAVIDNTWNWRQLSPATPPDARTGCDMVWDGTRVILFGGLTAGSPGPESDETWELVGDEWNQLSPSTVPSGRINHRMIWDGSKVLMMGGSLNDFPITPIDETWKFEAGNWTQISIATPIDNPYEHVMVWDTVNSRVLALIANPPPYVSDDNRTWEYTDGSGDWTDLTLSTEFPNIASVLLILAFGAWCGDRMVVGSGDDQGLGNRINGVYDLILDDWATRVSNNYATTYSAPSQFPMRRDSASVWTGDQLFFYGGADGSNAANISSVLGDQYVYDPTAFTVDPITTADTPGLCFEHRMVWDGTRVIMFGPRHAVAGGLTDETWVLEPPTPPNIASLRHTFGLGS